ncbi:MAG: hypothetical protein SO160_02455 [Lachnospiraceae bacterium]|nr:hypothetical protein [Lachnospiraceae bacterium]
MNDYLNDIKEVSKFLKEIYLEKHPDFIITPKMADFIFHEIVDDYQGQSAELVPENKELYDFLQNDRFIHFIESRQPNISKVPDNVIKDVVSYFQNDISGYIPLKVCRHSNHPDDSYIYSVIGRREQEDCAYACWSSFNESTKSINYGHYNLASEEEAMSIIRENFFDITDDLDNFGPEFSIMDISPIMDISQASMNMDEHGEQNFQQANVMRRRGR